LIVTSNNYLEMGRSLVNMIAVDDEHLALVGIEFTLKRVKPDCTLACFDTPGKALSYAKENRVDVAFLDIEMGGMSGLQLAKSLKEIYGETNIIFTTGYSRYAIDAFAMRVSGYLLKPVSVKAVAKAMDHLRHPVKPPQEKRVRIQTFGNFEVFIDEKPLKFKRTKTKELLAYLVMRGGALCSNRESVAVLWEDRPDCAALQSQYRHLVLDLTNSLKSADAGDVLVRQHGYLAVAPEKFSCDMYDFCAADANAVNSYMGEFMTQYSWAEFTNAYLGGLEK